MNKRRKVIVHIGTSADGYIARPDGDLERLTSRPAPEGFYGMNAFMKSVYTKVLWPEDLRGEPANGGEVRLKKSEHRVLPSSATSGRPVRRGVYERCNRPIREPSSRAAWQGYLVDGG